MAQCPSCGNRDVKETTVEQSFQVGAVLFHGELASTTCERCARVQIDPRSQRRVELLAARWLADRGAHDSVSFRFMRKAVGLRATELASLLGVQPETLSRWETGKRDVTRCAAAILGSLVVDASRGRSSLVDRLKAIQVPLTLDGAPVRLGS